VRKSNKSFERQGTKRPAGAISDVTDPKKSIAKKLAKMGANRQGAWATLLSQRPSSDDGDDMSAWLMQVMSVSDMNNPFHDSPTHVGSDFKPMMCTNMEQGSNDDSTSSEMEEENVNDSSSDTASNESSTPTESGSSDESSNDSITNDSASETQEPTNM
jgi:hypothetical protein